MRKGHGHHLHTVPMYVPMYCYVYVQYSTVTSEIGFSSENQCF
jgi:hypothetical protein